MSESEIISIDSLLRSGKPAAEIADRIDHGELHWRDDFGRLVVAAEIEKSLVSDSLKRHHKMKLDGGGLLTHDATGEYWYTWDSMDDEQIYHSPMGRSGFLSESAEKSDMAPKDTNQKHISPMLATLYDAAARYWENADSEDRDTHPVNAEVAKWLVTQGYSQTLADKAATIIRPEWAGVGRKPN